MKVFQVRNDVNRYQYFLTKDDGDAPKMVMDATSKQDSWVPPPVYIYQPKHKVGDFYQFAAGTLITSPRATNTLRGYLEQAGELLPLPYEGQVFTVLNTLQLVDCLDTTQAIKRPGYYAKYVFKHEILSHAQSPLFKIPQEPRGDLLLVEGLESTNHGFRTTIETTGLKGLVFKELWTDES